MSAVDPRVELLSRCDLKALENTRATASQRGDLALATAAHNAMQLRSVSQTPELTNCGKLFAHGEHLKDSYGMPTGRYVTRFTGDPSAWMQAYQSGATVTKINRKPKVVKVESVPLEAGERIQIVRD